MRLIEKYFRHLPEYYKTMYMDGFTPEEILYAFRRKFYKQIEEREREQQLQNDIDKMLDDLLKKLK